MTSIETRFTDAGPNTPLAANDAGATQSDIRTRFDLLDPAAMFVLAGILDYGIRRGYAPDNWRYIATNDHINHALMHLFAFLAGDTQDKHLDHAFTRLMFAVSVEAEGGPRTRVQA